MVHPAASVGFDREARAYERARPTYPPDAVAWLVDELRLGPDRLVVDLAAGTGKLTRLLTPTGARVVAVEPVAGMRDQLRSRTASAHVVAAVAEALPLRDGTADAVTIASAFHWFDGPRALVELHRVLRPSAALGLLWNRRVMSHPVQAAIGELIAPYRGSAPGRASGRWRAAFDTTDLFTPLVERSFPHAQQLDADGLADRVASISFVGALPDDERSVLLGRVRELAHDGPVTLPYDAEVYVCRRR